MTALEMAGVSLSLLPIDDDDEMLLKLLDAPSSHDAAWHGFSREPPTRHPSLRLDSLSLTPSPPSPPSPICSLPPPPVLIDTIKQVAKLVLQHEDLLTQLDQETGDGDFGITLARGVKAIHEQAEPMHTCACAAESLVTLGLALQRSMGGTSGALYGVFFLRMADGLRRSSGEKVSSKAQRWAEALKVGTDAISHLGGATKGK